MTLRIRSEVERLYREQGQKLWWAVLAYAGDREVASDAVAEAFAQVLRRGAAVRSPDKWVWRAAFKIAAGELKRRSQAVASRVEKIVESLRTKQFGTAHDAEPWRAAIVTARTRGLCLISRINRS